MLFQFHKGIIKGKEIARNIISNDNFSRALIKSISISRDIVNIYKRDIVSLNNDGTSVFQDFLKILKSM